MNYKDEVAIVPGKVSVRTIAENYSGAVKLLGVAADAKIDPHMAEAIAVVQVIEGKCEFTLDDRKIPMSEGDFVVVAPAIVHSLVPVDGDVKVLLTKLNNDKR